MALRLRLLAAAQAVRDSYWFIPGLLTLAGGASALSLVVTDARIGASWIGRVPWLYASQPEGARTMLGAIAGSTITVAGTVFSVTLAALTYASGQHGPRLLRHFNRDRANQATLGVFLGTFLYCLIVLRSVRSAVEASAQSGGAVRDAFVPHMAMLGALALATLSVAMLIFFVHHVTETIQIDNAVAAIGRGLLERVASHRRGETASQGALWPGGEHAVIAACATGYIQAVDLDALAQCARAHDAAVEFVRRPGDFVHSGRRLAHVWPPARGEALAADVNAAISLGGRRTPLQDLRFEVNELVEIAARALSPGINDPFTARACIDWLGAALAELERTDAVDDIRRDEGGRPRARLPAIDFAAWVELAFGQLRQHAMRDDIVRARALETLRQLGEQATHPARRALIDTERARWTED